MKRQTYLLLLSALILQSCGDELFSNSEQSLQSRQDLIMADTTNKINAIEAKRRTQPDFKCSVPEIPGHTLGENPACVGRPDYTTQRAGK